MQFWLDLKQKTKGAVGELSRSQKKTGGGEGVPYEILTPRKEKIISLLGGDTAVVGDQHVQCFGFAGGIISYLTSYFF